MKEKEMQIDNIVFLAAGKMDERDLRVQYRTIQLLHEPIWEAFHQLNQGQPLSASKWG